MRSVVWSDDAKGDLREILGYIALTDLDHALWLVDQLESAGDRLGAYLTGRPGRVDGTYEKSLPTLRYIIAFTVDLTDEGDITILRVVHSARNWPEGQWPE